MLKIIYAPNPDNSKKGPKTEYKLDIDSKPSKICPLPCKPTDIHLPPYNTIEIHPMLHNAAAMRHRPHNNTKSALDCTMPPKSP